MPITNEDVWLAADRVADKGQKPTLAAVRKELGGGSFSTISDAMADWRRRQHERVLEASEPLPKPVADQIDALGRAIWSAASEAAGDRLRSQYERFELERAELQSARAEVAEVASQTSHDLEAMQGRLNATEEELASNRKELQVLRDRLTETGERLAAAQAHTAEADRRISDLNRELERVNEANTALIRALAERPVGKATAKA